MNRSERNASFEFGTGVSTSIHGIYKKDLSPHEFKRSSASASPDHNCITINNHLRVITPVYPCAQLYLFWKVIDRVWTIWQEITIRQTDHTWPSYAARRSLQAILATSRRACEWARFHLINMISLNKPHVSIKGFLHNHLKSFGEWEKSIVSVYYCRNRVECWPQAMGIQVNEWSLLTAFYPCQRT